MQRPPHVGSFWKTWIEQRRDAGARLARAGVAGDEPAAAEVCARPFEAGESNNRRVLFGRSEKREQRERSAASQSATDSGVTEVVFIGKRPIENAATAAERDRARAA